jgi:hypothetical protein
MQHVATERLEKRAKNLANGETGILVTCKITQQRGGGKLLTLYLLMFRPDEQFLEFDIEDGEYNSHYDQAEFATSEERDSFAAMNYSDI